MTLLWMYTPYTAQAAPQLISWAFVCSVLVFQPMFVLLLELTV